LKKKGERKRSTQDEERALEVLRYYRAIVNARTFYNLRDTLEAVKQFTLGFSKLQFNDIAQAINTNEHIEAIQVVKHVVRRFTLIRFCTRYQEIIESRNYDGTSRAQSEVLDKLARESFSTSSVLILLITIES